MTSHKEKIKKLREDFSKGSLNETEVSKLPCEQFDHWISQAIAAQVPEAQAMVLSTVSKDDRPSSRVVYLREYDKDQFWFYGNYDSKKAAEMLANPNVSLNFFWPVLERQIRIEGTVTKATAEQSDHYFNARPLESKIGAWSSPQSKKLNSRKELEDAVEDNHEKFHHGEVPRPDFWGGFLVKANYYEFWQGRKNRLHDRIVYTLEKNSWVISRLAP